ncbi:MAG: restriction endonuclease [Helicobacteraceae bacterium]|jgi:hypothetical protein|nr:restriction endonuclease [Helicobacteraceae bacterium]
MKWLKNEDIQNFLSQRNYDVRISGNARWIDQKCTADVVMIVSDCIVCYVEDVPKKIFSSRDIWYNKYTVENVEAIFKKPNPNEAKARNEYDKFFQQPMEMLAYAGVLIKTKKGNSNLYSIGDNEILEYLAIRDRNALTFLQLYISKVLSDSGIKHLFDEFFDKQTKATFYAMKDGFSDFTIKHTKINKSLECNRIFTKVLNPLAFQLSKYGTEKGRLSKDKITLDMLMYNRNNFRDIYADKPKDLTRRQYAEKENISLSSSLISYMSQKAKRLVRSFNDSFRDGKSEVFDERHNSDLATNIHHIFPGSEFPEISAYCENLIALTPTQHFNYAHPDGNTHRIDATYQHICLIAKASVIKETLSDLNREQIYEFRKFMYVLFVGLDNEAFNCIADGDFDDAITAINLAYAA